MTHQLSFYPNSNALLYIERFKSICLLCHLGGMAEHGFTNGRSCLTNLLETFESWTEDVDKGYSVGVIFWIFKKPLIKCRKQDYCKRARPREG